MTETEWLTCTKMEKLLKFLQQKGSDRKWRLFAVTCCLRIRHGLDEQSLKALNVVERFADGLASEEERTAAHVAIERAIGPMNQDAPPSELAAVHYATAAVACHYWDADEDVAGTADGAAEHVSYAVANAVAAAIPVDESDPTSREVRNDAWHRSKQNEEKAQSILLRDIFGNPFKAVTFIPAWLTTTVVALAQSIYNERNFDHMPILGDALEEAGCDNADILQHCRQPNTHVRGCWVIDLILGKE